LPGSLWKQGLWKHSLCVRRLHFTPSATLEPDFSLIWQRCRDFTTGASRVYVNRCICVKEKLFTHCITARLLLYIFPRHKTPKYHHWREITCTEEAAWKPAVNQA